MKRDIPCNGPICNTNLEPFTEKAEPENLTMNFISLEGEDLYQGFAKHGWSVFVTPDGKNYFCPRCTTEIMNRMRLR